MTIVLSYISYIYLYNKWIILLFTTERNFTSIFYFCRIYSCPFTRYLRKLKMTAKMQMEMTISMTVTTMMVVL